jgi:cholest-4-en-3-one 26-monooxygenase
LADVGPRAAPVAGETTRNLLTGAVLAFAEFPGEWERLRADAALLRPAIEELL